MAKVFSVALWLGILLSANALANLLVVGFSRGSRLSWETGQVPNSWNQHVACAQKRGTMTTSSFTLDMATAVQVVANSLSTLTIMSCLFLKVPQILNIREKKSAEGIYIQAMAMEIIGFTIMTLYNFMNQYSMMTYLEYPIILLQVYVMLYYVLKYKRMLDLTVVPLLTATYFASIAGVLLDILPKSGLSYLLPLCTPLSGFAKVAYMYGIVKSRNADNVSLTTWIISTLTNLARVFTVYVDSADPKLMANFFVSTLLSSGVLGTALYYQHASCTAPQQRTSSFWRRPHAD